MHQHQTFLNTLDIEDAYAEFELLENYEGQVEEIIKTFPGGGEHNMYQTFMTIKTERKQEVVDITGQINEVIGNHNIEHGIILLFVLHSTAALTTVAFAPGRDLELLESLKPDMPSGYEHLHGYFHLPHHLISALLQQSLVLPIKDNQLLLGPTQKIGLVELNGPKDRQIAMMLFDHEGLKLPALTAAQINYE